MAAFKKTSFVKLIDTSQNIKLWLLTLNMKYCI